jgi:hypothetical protein
MKMGLSSVVASFALSSFSLVSYSPKVCDALQSQLDELVAKYNAQDPSAQVSCE